MACIILPEIQKNQPRLIGGEGGIVPQSQKAQVPQAFLSAWGHFRQIATTRMSAYHQSGLPICISQDFRSKRCSVENAMDFLCRNPVRKSSRAHGRRLDETAYYAALAAVQRRQHCHGSAAMQTGYHGCLQFDAHSLIASGPGSPAWRTRAPRVRTQEAPARKLRSGPRFSVLADI